MIQLLFVLLGAEVALVFVLLFKTPLRKLTVLGLDRLKRGRGPIMVKTVAATFVVVLASSIYSIAKITVRSDEIGGALSPTDQVLKARHLLEASLMGYALLLALVIDRLHHYIRDLRSLRNSVEAVTKQNRALEEAKIGALDKMKTIERFIASLNEQKKALKSEIEARAKEAKTAEANNFALKKQSEGFLLEYDRLLDENENLRSQLQSIDRTVSYSDRKKTI